MNENQYIKKLLKIGQNYEIEKYGEARLKQNHVPFTGTPKKHPHDKKILILLTDPFARDKQFYEFSVDSIGMVEELGTVASEYDETAIRIRIWVKKGMPAFKTEPFIVV